jgi:hypothetical protein
MLLQSKKKPSPRLKRSALHIPSRKPWPKLSDPKPPPRPHSAPQCPKSPRRVSWSPSDAQRKPHALAMRCRPIGSVCVASASTQPFPSLPFPSHGAQPRLDRLLGLGAARRNQAPSALLPRAGEPHPNPWLVRAPRCVPQPALPPCARGHGLLPSAH